MTTEKSGLGYLVGATAAIAIVVGAGFFVYSRINRGQDFLFIQELTGARN